MPNIAKSQLASILKCKTSKIVGISIFFIFIIWISYPGIFADFSSKIPRGAKPDLLYIASIINYSINAPLREIYHLPFYYPSSYITTYGHPLFGISIVFKLFKFCHLNFCQSYNLYIIFIFLIGAWGCFLLAREISRNALFSLAFSTFYILFNRNYLHFIWLNFLSNAYLPYIFYFFIRYMKSGKKTFLIWGSFFAFFQFFASVYYGFYLWAFIIPSFLIFSLVLKICSWKKLIAICIGLCVAFTFIFLIYHPFQTIKKQDKVERVWDKSEMNPKDFFNLPNTLFYLGINKLGKYKYQSGYKFIPGYTFTFFILGFFTVNLAKRRKTYLSLLMILFLITSFLLFEDMLFFELSFLVLCVFLIYLTILSWKNMDVFTKLILLTVTFFFLLLLNFQKLYIIKDISILKILFNQHIIPGMDGLRAFKRIIPICTSFLIALAAATAAKWSSRTNYSHIKSIALATMTVLLIFIENYGFAPQELMKSMPNPEIYKKLPFKKNKIILELPFYSYPNEDAQFRTRYFMYNWIFHQNYLINGSTSFLPQRYFQDFYSIVPPFDETFPNEPALKILIDNYSLTHIVFHLNWLDDLKNPMKKNLRNIRNYGEIIYQDHNNVILQVQELIPIRQLTRTFSYVHLRYHKIKIILKDEYFGECSLFLNKKALPKIELKGKEIDLNFQNANLDLDKNKVEIFFNREIVLADIIIQ